jgi:hypothetical protein
MNIKDELMPILEMIEKSPEATEATAELKAKVIGIVMEKLGQIAKDKGIPVSAIIGYITGAIGILAVILKHLGVI